MTFNKKGVSLPSVLISGVMVVIVLLLSPFMFELLGVSSIGGVEGFFARLIPFIMLWAALRAGAFKAVGQ